jgi:hypothetical protein
MRFLKSNFSNTWYFLILFLALQSCSKPDEIGEWKNDAIKPERRAEFHQLNDQLFDALKANDMEKASAQMSQELLEDEGAVKRTMELVSNRSKTGGYTLLDEYYYNADKEPGSMVISSAAEGVDAYSFKYSQSTTKANYVALLKVPKNGLNQGLITVIYGKYNYGWKVNKLSFGEYSFNGKNAPQLYKLAKEKRAKGYLLDAVNDMAAAQQCFHPNQQWEYASENQMNSFYYNMVMLVNSKYKFPYVIKEVSTQPKIIRIGNQNLPDGTFPLISYISNIPLRDTLGLRKENNNVKKVIGKVLPGIDKDKKHIMYAIFNGLPGGKISNLEYDLTDNLR